MSSFREKVQFFLLGLMFGLLVGVGFFIFKLDDYFSELKFYKNLSKNVLTSINTEKETSAQAENNISATKSNSSATKWKPSSVNKTMTDSMSGLAVADTTFTAKDSSAIANSNEENIVIKKDELLFTRTIEITAVVSGNKLLSDTVVEKLAGVKNSQPTAILVEFWQSPLNYKGYKMSKNKLVLYGVSSTELYKIYKYENTVFLKTSFAAYKLDVTNDFKSFDRVEDAATLSLLN
ncbi:MAG: hypothetical protein J0M08_13060 [Bacteroidetes bacterium]|nr:hypothetical protein [Bacteroidota bacterium]